MMVSISLMLFFVVPFGVVAGASLISIARERARFRAGDISLKHPGCSGCLYPVGSWSSSACPECGVDAAVHGVRVGPRWRRPMLRAGIAGMVFGVVLPFVGVGMSWVLASDTDLEVTNISGTDPRHRVTITVRTEWSRLPPRHRRDVDVAVNSGPAVSWSSGPSTIDDGEDLKARLIRAGVFDESDPRLEPHAEALGRIVALLPRTESLALSPPVAAPYIYTGGSSGTMRGGVPWREGVTLLTALLGSILLAGGFAEAVFRRLDDGRRPSDASVSAGRDDARDPAISRADSA